MTRPASFNANGGRIETSVTEPSDYPAVTNSVTQYDFQGRVACVQTPAFARWLSHAPVGEKGGLNRHGYVENDPMNNTDSLGLWRRNLGPIFRAFLDGAVDFRFNVE